MDDYRFLKNRQNPLRATPPEEVEDSLATITEFFGLNWLNGPGDNPVQIVWKRQDSLATCELFILGHAIRNVADLNRKWINDKVRIVKGRDRNNTQGALNEIIGLDYFRNGNSDILPAKRGQPGYDAVLKLKTGVVAKVSFKVFGYSVHHAVFINEARKTEEELVKLINKCGLKDIQLVTIFRKGLYPSNKHWRALRSFLPKIVSQYRGLRQVLILEGIGTVLLKDLGYPAGVLDPEYLSYNFIVSASYHKNESKNITSRLSTAYNNLAKFGLRECPNAFLVLYARIPLLVSINSSAEFVEGFLERNSDLPPTVVILYQPGVTKDMKRNISRICHSFRFVSSKSSAGYFTSNEETKLSLITPVGIVSSEPSQYQINVGDKVIKIDDHYIYSSGHAYKRAVKKDNGTLTGDITNLGIGFYEHAVLETPDGRKLRLSGKFPPTNDLLLV